MALSQLSFEVGKDFPSTWDLGTDVLDGFEQFMELTPNLESIASYQNQQASQQHSNCKVIFDQSPVPPHEHGTKSSTLSEKRQQSNRAAQKRYRERRKARSQTTEAQLAETQNELHELRIRSKQLEARNSLLEKAAKLNRQPAIRTEDPGLSHGDSGDLWSSLWAAAAGGLDGMVKDQDRVVTFTVGAADKTVSIEEVAKLPAAEFRRVYTLYARKLGACLLESSGPEPSTATDDMNRWIREMSCLMVCVSLGNPRGLKDFQVASMDGLESSGTVDELADSFYEDLLAAMELTEAQVQDLLYLRRLFCGKLGQLGRARKQLVSKLPTEALGACHVSDKLEHLTQIAEQLTANGREEYRSYMQFSCAFYRGILTARQKAIAVVHSYPWVPEKHRLLSVLADQRSATEAQAFSQTSGIDDLQHAANWQQVEEYLKTVTVNNVHVYLPFS